MFYNCLKQLTHQDIYGMNVVKIDPQLEKELSSPKNDAGSSVDNAVRTNLNEADNTFPGMMSK